MKQQNKEAPAVRLSAWRTGAFYLQLPYFGSAMIETAI